MNGAGGLRRHMAGDPAGEGELPEQLLHAFGIPGNIRVDLGVGSFQIGLGDHGVSAVSRAGKVDHVQIIAADNAVEMSVDKVLSGDSSPVSHDLLFDLLGLQRGAQQRVFQQIQLPGGKIVGGAPISVDLL